MKRLRLLWELSARGTIAAVAEELFYSPSAVSQQLAILEREAGVALVRKSGRTLELTPAGVALAKETEKLLAGLERAEATLRNAGTEATGTMRISVFQTALLAMLPPALDHLKKHHPHMRVQVVQREPETALHGTWARSFDLVVAEQYPGHAAAHFTGLDRKPLIEDPLHLALPSPANADDSFNAITSIREAGSVPWVMEPHGAASRHWAEQLCRRYGFEPDVRYETADLQAHVRLIESGNAVALLPGLVHIGIPHHMRLIGLPGNPHREVFTAARESSAGSLALVAVRDSLTSVADSLRFD